MRGFVQQELEILQARRRPRLQRARRNRVHPEALGSEFIGQVAAGALQRRLHRAHDVVVPDNSVRADIAHGEHGAAVCHQRRREVSHSDEGMAGHVHRLGKAFGRTVEKPALEISLGRKSDRMHENVQPSPAGANLLKDRLQLSGDGNVNLACDRGFEFHSKRLNEASRLVVQPGDREIGPEGVKRLRAAVGDGIFIGDADDERLFALQHRAQLYGVHAKPLSWSMEPLPCGAPPRPRPRPRKTRGGSEASPRGSSE